VDSNSFFALGDRVPCRLASRLYNEPDLYYFISEITEIHRMESLLLNLGYTIGLGYTNFNFI